MKTIRHSFRSVRQGMTLVELLVVAGILVLFVAVAAPLLKPATADRKIREASRQVNAYIAEAKTIAAQRGRSVSIVFDRASALNEGARDSNKITRLNIAESPPIYAGDTNSSFATIGYMGDPVSNPMNFTGIGMPPWYSADVVPPTINGFRAQWYELTFPNDAMLNVIMDSYISDSSVAGFVPFRVKLAGLGSYYDGYVQYTQGGTPPYRYFMWAPFGTPGFTPPTANPINATFEIECFPQLTSDAPLELPTGTVVDLQFSGLGKSGQQFFDATQASTTPVILVFSPSGEMDRISFGGTFTNQLARVHLLVGSMKRAIDVGEAVPADVYRAAVLNEKAAQWVSIQTRSGSATTADNAGFDSDPPNASTFPLTFPASPTYLPTAIANSRDFATTLNTKGGR